MNPPTPSHADTSQFETMVAQHAQGLRYPTTPDIANAVAERLAERRPQRARRFLQHRREWLVAWLILAAILWSVPPVRAALLEFIQIGAVRIWRVEPTPTATPLPSTVTAAPTATPKTALLPLSGATSLANARQKVSWPIRLPTWPPELGEPDAVFLQDLDGTAVVLVWFDPADRSRVRLSLHMLSSSQLVWNKMAPQIVEETSVHNQPAKWTTGPYLLVVRQKGIDPLRLIEGHVLIWQENGITYRLETDQSLADAVHIAESLS